MSTNRDVVVVGGSDGSLAPLLSVLGALEPELRASVFVVQHRTAHAAPPLDVVAASTALKVELARDQARFEHGAIYLAPSDRHLLLTHEHARVVHGPRENLARPSIDVLFRSAAVTLGARVIGVLLSGALHDGAAGLAAIRRCGGFCIVQDPADALNGDLPRSALEMSPSKSVAAAEIGPLINQLVKEQSPDSPQVPGDLALEARAAATAMVNPEELSRIGEPSHFSCPECDGPLWLMPSAPQQFRCDVGHAFSLDTFEQGQSRALERALWVSYRILAERARLLDDLVQSSRSRGMTAVAMDYEKRMHELHHHSRSVLAAMAAIERTAGSGEPTEESA